MKKQNQAVGWLVMAVVVVVCFMAGVCVSPYVVVYNFQRAIKANNASAVSGSIDISSVRQNLKAQFETYLAREKAKGNTDHAAAALASIFAMAFIDPMFHLLVSPEGMAVLLRGEKPELDVTGKIKQSPKPAPARTALFYKGVNEFVVHAENIEKKSSTDLIFKRYGLFSWKLAAVRMDLY